MSVPTPVSPAQAVKWGHMIVSVPVFIIAGVVATVSYAIYPLLVLVGTLFGLGLGWLWWSFAIARWRDWVESVGLRPDDVQDLAVRTWLVWPRGSWLERTEFRRQNGRRGW
jgi:hypothetical protein